MPFLNYVTLFKEEVRRNSELASCKAKPKVKGIGRKMSPEDLLKKLEELGVSINRSTLTRYIQWGLVTAPEQRSGGKGVKANFPDHAVAEAAAAAYFLREKRAKKEAVAEARRVAQMLKAHGISFEEIEERDDLGTSLGINLIRILEARTWQLIFEHYLIKTADQANSK